METVVQHSRRSLEGRHGIVSPAKLAHYVLVTRDMRRLRDWYLTANDYGEG